jgi:TonB family protein
VSNRKFESHLSERCWRRPVTVLAVALVCVFGLSSLSFAQKASKSERKVLVSVKPDYSEILRRAQIGGLVRLRATVTAEGKVTNVEVVGGNPILAESAATAVRSWKYAPAPAQTVEDVAITFTPH